METEWILRAVCLALLLDPGMSLQCFFCSDPCVSKYLIMETDITCDLSNFCVKRVDNRTGIPEVRRYCSRKIYHGKPGCTGSEGLIEICYCDDRVKCNGSLRPIAPLVLVSAVSALVPLRVFWSR